MKTAYVEKVLKQHGLGGARLGKPARKKGARWFERVEKNELWQMDVMYYTLKRDVRFYLISVLDDYSRFICANRLCTAQRADNVIDTFSDAVEQHGSPQQVLSDRGSQFHTWNGVSQFRKTLAKLGVEHIVSSPQSPQTIGYAK